jgi:hypothetical protein
MAIQFFEDGECTVDLRLVVGEVGNIRVAQDRRGGKFIFKGQDNRILIDSVSACDRGLAWA